MLEALWSMEFVSNVQGWGAGVAVLETGRILGGDGQYFYVGTYEQQNGKAKAKVEVQHYSGQRNSIFGSLDKFNLVLEGLPERDGFVLSGHVEEDPNCKLHLHLTRRAELPNPA